MDFAGLCFMGGEMSVNDPLPWLEAELALIRRAVMQDIPVIGHCLGGQLMAKALGGVVTRNPVREIGWGNVQVADNQSAHEWLPGQQDFAAFHWHGETFTLPDGAIPLFASTHCANQAFALGPHLGMQCHVEMTETLIAGWVTNWHDELSAPDAPLNSIQSARALNERTATALPEMRRVAHGLYEKWLAGVHARELARTLPPSE